MGTAVGTDVDQVVAAATDYLTSFYSGTAEERETRIERVLHPHLAKRTPRMDHEWTVSEMIEIAARSVNEPQKKRPYSVRVLDISGNMASVRSDAAWGVDYMHLAKIDREWKVVNVLWDVA
jgi:hypothetical protein